MDVGDTIFISENVNIDKTAKIWHFAQIRENAKIGRSCIIGKNAYIDHDVIVGDDVKIQNNCSIYYMTIIEDGVFIGPHVIVTNDKTPRAIDISGKLKLASGWKAEKTTIKKGASIGAGSIILPGITIGQYAMIGAGSVVTKNVDDFALVYGNPARNHGYVCRCGLKMAAKNSKNILSCKTCGTEIKLK